MQLTEIYESLVGRGKLHRPLITIAGDNEVLIENCKRLIECSEIKCSVLSAGYLVEVWGTELSASRFANGSASVSGRIRNVNIERRKGGAAL